MNVQYVRLNDGVCETLNDLARDARKTVSDVVNEILREYLRSQPEKSAAESPK